MRTPAETSIQLTVTTLLAMSLEMLLTMLWRSATFSAISDRLMLVRVVRSMVMSPLIGRDAAWPKKQSVMGGKTVSSSNSLSLGSQRLGYPCRNQRFWYWRRTVCVQNVPHAGVYPPHHPFPSSRPQPRVSNPNSDERKEKRKDATLSCSGEIGVGWLPAERFGA